MKKPFSVLALLFLLALTACNPSPGSGGTIDIGFIGPLTGDAAAYGIDTLNGLRMKVEEINDAGGIDGKQIEIIVEDAKCNGADGASAAQKLASVDKVVAIIGGSCSSETLAAAPIVEAAKIPLISPLSSSPDITAAGEYVYRNYPSDALKTKAMAAYFRSKGFTRVAVISENTDFCQGFRDSLRSDFGELVFNESVEPGTKDFRTLMTRLADTEFDVFVANGQTPATIAAMVQQLREAGLSQVVITHDAGQTAETITLGGDAVEKLQAINIPSLGEDTDFGTKLVSVYGQPRGGIAFSGHAYDAMGVLAKVIDEVGTDGAAMKASLDAMTPYAGVVGTFGFDENGDVVGINYKLMEVQEGAWVELQDVAAE